MRMRYPIFISLIVLAGVLLVSFQNCGGGVPQSSSVARTPDDIGTPNSNPGFGGGTHCSTTVGNPMDCNFKPTDVRWVFKKLADILNGEPSEVASGVQSMLPLFALCTHKIEFLGTTAFETEYDRFFVLTSYDDTPVGADARIPADQVYNKVIVHLQPTCAEYMKTNPTMGPSFFYGLGSHLLLRDQFYPVDMATVSFGLKVGQFSWLQRGVNQRSYTTGVPLQMTFTGSFDTSNQKNIELDFSYLLLKLEQIHSIDEAIQILNTQTGSFTAN